MSITKQVENYIAGHPSILDCLKKDLINYSELSRQVCDELGIRKFDAALIACRRYFWKLKKDSVSEAEIISLVKTSRLLVKNKMIVAILEKPRDMEKIYSFQKRVKKAKGDFNLIEGNSVITIITNEAYLEEIKKDLASWLLKTTGNLAEVIMVFNEKIETTAGVVAHIYNLLSEKGINVLEEMSCWTDLLIVIDEKDIPAAMKILSFY
jgi:aspartokinase